MPMAFIIFYSYALIVSILLSIRIELNKIFKPCQYDMAFDFGKISNYLGGNH